MAMTYEAVTFDCAETLLGVDYHPARLAGDSLEALGVRADYNQVMCTYDAVLRRRYGQFIEANLTRDEAQVDEFWRDLTVDWLKESELPADLLQPVIDEANRRIYGEGSEVLFLFKDVKPCLDRLKAAGFRMAVVSNWDISLTKCLRAFDLLPYFEVVCASMVEGFEKPDPRLFRVALNHLGVAPEKTMHIGDDVAADIGGARKAGIKAMLIDRSQKETGLTVLKSLEDLPAVLGL